MKEKLKVGDKVKVKSWKQMKKEYGVNSLGDIKCTYTFVKNMKKFCGKTARIMDVCGGDKLCVEFDDGSSSEGWTFGTDMFEKIHKFKVGDIIRGKKCGRYSITDEHMTKAKVISSDNSTMKIKILQHDCSSEVGETFDVENSNEYFEKVSSNETIVIYRKGNQMIALDKSTGEKAVAKCSTEDEFDYKVGAKLAFNRLIGDEENSNFKVLCVEDTYLGSNLVFKKGKVYEYVNGCCLREDNRESGKYDNFSDLIEHNSIYKGKLFEVKEVKRKAKTGEYVKIVDEMIVPITDGKPEYKNGDVLRCIGEAFCGSIMYGIISIEDGSKRPIYGEPLKDIDDVKDYFTAPSKRKREFGLSSKTLELIEVKE